MKVRTFDVTHTGSLEGGDVEVIVTSTTPVEGGEPQVHFFHYALCGREIRLSEQSEPANDVELSGAWHKASRHIERLRLARAENPVPQGELFTG